MKPRSNNMLCLVAGSPDTLLYLRREPAPAKTQGDDRITLSVERRAALAMPALKLEFAQRTGAPALEVVDTQGDYILTLYEKRVDPADLPGFLGLMQHLATRGITCPLPVRGRDGAALRMLAGRHAAITTFLPGVWPRRVRQEHCGPLA